MLAFVYNGLNELDAKFFRKEHPDYRSKFSLHLLAITLLWIIYIAVSIVSIRKTHTNGFSLYFQIAILMYCVVFLKRQLPLLSGVGRKIGYGLFTLFFLVLIGPLLFPLLLAVILLAVAVQIALLLLTVAVWVIDLFHSGSGGKRFKLDNGDTVTEKAGLFGEKSYEGESGKSYATNDRGETFREKE